MEATSRRGNLLRRSKRPPPPPTRSPPGGRGEGREGEGRGQWEAGCGETPDLVEKKRGDGVGRAERPGGGFCDGEKPFFGKAANFSERFCSSALQSRPKSRGGAQELQPLTQVNVQYKDVRA